MSEMYEKLRCCLESVRNKTDFVPETALVLGSGLGNYAENIRVEATLDYADIKGFPVSTVPGHKGRYIFGTIGRTPVVCMQGRIHYYEGYSMEEVVLPIRLMRLMGAKQLFLTNAAGGINPGMKAGDFMMITGQIASFVPSPLRGENDERLGVRFPDMTDLYDVKLQEAIRKASVEHHIPIKEGTYIQLGGPNYETPQEVSMCRILGADAVGMSTACEAIAGKHAGMRVCGISCISNLAAGISNAPLSHQEVQETADRVAPLFQKLVTASIRNMEELL